MLSKQQKDKIIEKFKTHASDTGSPQVQIALLTSEIKDLTEHLKEHKKDFSSRRGLLKKVGERRRLLRYLEREDAKAFEEVCKALKLKIAKRVLTEREQADADAKAAREESAAEEVA